MPIRINLLSEALAAEELRRRDPVKQAIFAGAFFVALSLVWFSSVRLTSVVKNIKLDQVKHEVAQHTNDYARALNSKKRNYDLQSRLDSLDQLVTNRFLQGNLLNALQQIYVTNVVLSHLRVDQRSATTPAVSARTNNGVLIPGHPATVTEHVLLTLGARDFSSNPGDQVERFKEALFQQDYFHLHLQTNGIRLSSLSGLQTPVDSKPHVVFGLECRFTDRNP
jgi:hypothetical protein